LYVLTATDKNLQKSYQRDTIEHHTGTLASSCWFFAVFDLSPLTLHDTNAIFTILSCNSFTSCSHFPPANSENFLLTITMPWFNQSPVSFYF